MTGKSIYKLGTKCIIPNCNRYNKIDSKGNFANGLCHKHYNQQNQSKLIKERRIKLIGLLGGKCVDPYQLHLPNDPFLTDWRNLQLDHIKGYGKKQRYKNSEFTNSITTVKYYLKHLEQAKSEIQILCANCNWIKKYENKESANEKYMSEYYVSK